MADPESTGIVGSVLGVLGLTSWGGKQFWNMSRTQSAHATQIEAMDTKQKEHAETLETLKEQGTRTETTLTDFGSDIDEIKSGISAIKNHITGTNLG